jgi:hypothetical protein
VGISLPVVRRRLVCIPDVSTIRIVKVLKSYRPSSVFRSTQPSARDSSWPLSNGRSSTTPLRSGLTGEGESQQDAMPFGAIGILYQSALFGG